MKKSCLTEEKLADYMEHRLSGKERAKIEAHLSDCEGCLEDLTITRGLMGKESGVELEPVPDRWKEIAISLYQSERSKSPGSFKEIFQRSMRNLRVKLSELFDPAQWENYRFAPIRSSKTVVSRDLIHLRKAFKEIEVEIEIEKTGENRTHIRVNALNHGRYEKGIRVTLIKGEREICSNLLSEGYVLFEDIVFGHYSLSFSKGGKVIGKYLFEIKESSNG